MDQPKSSQVPVHVKLEEKLADDEEMPLWACRGIVDFLFFHVLHCLHLGN